MFGLAGAAPRAPRSRAGGALPRRLGQAACAVFSSCCEIPGSLGPRRRETRASSPDLSLRGSPALACDGDPGVGYGRKGNAGLFFILLCNPPAHTQVRRPCRMAEGRVCTGRRGKNFRKMSTCFIRMTGTGTQKRTCAALPQEPLHSPDLPYCDKTVNHKELCIFLGTFNPPFFFILTATM